MVSWEGTQRPLYSFRVTNIQAVMKFGNVLQCFVLSREINDRRKGDDDDNNDDKEEEIEEEEMEGKWNKRCNKGIGHK